MSLVRDQEYEQRFLELAAEQGGTVKFVRHAQRRLEHGEEAFGDRWTGMSLLEFLRELAEEAADLGAWAALAAQRIAGGPDEYPSGVRRQIEHALQQLAMRGAAAHNTVEAIHRVVSPQGEPAS